MLARDVIAVIRPLLVREAALVVLYALAMGGLGFGLGWLLGATP